MKKKNPILKEYNSWMEKLESFSEFEELTIKWLENSKYLRNVWEYFLKEFNEFYKHIEDSQSLINKYELSKESLMIEMFRPIRNDLEKNFYSIYKNYEEKEELAPWLDENGNQKYDEKNRPMQLVKIVKTRKLKDYTISEQLIKTIVLEHFSITNLLVAILKQNKKLLEVEKQKAKRRKVDENQLKRYRRIIELWVQVEISEPNLSGIVRRIYKEEEKNKDPKIKNKGKADDLYFAFIRWKKSHPQLYQAILQEFRDKLKN